MNCFSFSKCYLRPIFVRVAVLGGVGGVILCFKRADNFCFLFLFFVSIDCCGSCVVGECSIGDYV